MTFDQVVGVHFYCEFQHGPSAALIYNVFKYRKRFYCMMGGSWHVSNHAPKRENHLWFQTFSKESEFVEKEIVRKGYKFKKFKAKNG